MRTFFAAAVLLVGLCSAHAAAKPNIVIILTDDQDLASVAFMPSVNALLKTQGLTFTNSFLQMPQCGPSRASLMTGQMPHNNGAWRNDASYAALKPEEANLLPVWLKRAGYRTGLVGKYINLYENDFTHLPLGWDTWNATNGQSFFNWQLNENGTIVSYGSSPADYSTDVLAQKARDFVGGSGPFFLLLSPTAPHAPYVPAPRHVGMFSSGSAPQGPAFNEADVSDKPGYIQSLPLLNVDTVNANWRKRLEQLQSVDDLIGGLVARLTETGQIDNTILIFTSDNGWCMGDHRLEAKRVGYECSLRVPLIVRGPGIPVGARSQMVSNVDLASTILELAEAEPGRTQDGKSIVPLFSNAAAPWRSAMFIQGLIIGSPVPWYGVRTETRKLMQADGFSFKELYALDADADELENRASDQSYASDLHYLGLMTRMLKTCAGESCWVQ